MLFNFPGGRGGVLPIVWFSLGRLCLNGVPFLHIKCINLFLWKGRECFSLFKGCWICLIPKVFAKFWQKSQRKNKRKLRALKQLKFRHDVVFLAYFWGIWLGITEYRYNTIQYNTIQISTMRPPRKRVAPPPPIHFYFRNWTHLECKRYHSCMFHVTLMSYCSNTSTKILQRGVSCKSVF